MDNIASNDNEIGSHDEKTGQYRFSGFSSPFTDTFEIPGLPKDVLALIPEDFAAEPIIVTSELVIGRKKDCNLFLDDITVSRTHARIHKTEGIWNIEDNDSLNGTYVDGQRIQRKVPQSGETLQVGKFRFLVILS